MSYSEWLFCVYASSLLGIGCEIWYRSKAGGGDWFERRRMKRQTATATRAITAAPTPTPTPILAPSDSPLGESAAAASEVAAAVAADVVPLVVVLATFVAAEVVDDAGAVDDDDDDSVFAVAELVDVTRVVLVELVDGTSEDDAEVGVGAPVVVGAGVAGGVVEVGTAAPTGRVAAAVCG